jgi:transposase
MTNKMLQRDASETGRLLVAIEMSLSKWGLSAAREGQPRKRVKTVAGGDYQALLEAVADFKARFKLPLEAPVVFCYEAGRDGFYPYRRLTELGHEVWVIDSASIEVSRHRRNAKSDGIDADKLVELMQRKAGGEQRALRVVRVPAEGAEDQRQLPRERESLLTDRRRVLNQIESLLFIQGYREVPQSSRALKVWLEQSRALGPQLRARVQRDVERLALLESQLTAVERRLKEQAHHAHAGHIGRVACALMQLCGIGLIGAWVLASEIYGWRVFRNRKEVGSALGLTPTPYSSGTAQREQGISKAGNKRARSLLVELSWLWLRYQPDSALSQWFKARFSGGGKRLRRIGIVALARRLAVALWRYTAQGVIPEGARLKAAGA